MHVHFDLQEHKRVRELEEMLMERKKEIESEFVSLSHLLPAEEQTAIKQCG